MPTAIDNTSTAKLGGHNIPSNLIREFKDSSTVSDAAELRRRLDEDGNLFLRGAVDKQDVLAAREEVFSRLAEVGEIKPPAIDGITTGESRRRELAGDLIEFWRSVSEGPALRHVSHGPQIRQLMQTIFDEPARPQDYLWLRPRPIGWSTRLHFDHPFFARGSDRVHTVWIALGDVPLCDGPLVLVENSNKFLDLIQPMHDRDEKTNQSPELAEQAAFRGEWDDDPITFVERRETHFLSANMSAGDVVIFGMNTLHGALDNDSPIARVRLSCDVRYQPESDPRDDRYFGPKPTGASGKGYGDMTSCKPLNET